VLLVISTCRFSRGSGATSGRQGQWLLHQDDSPSHTALVVSSPSHRTLRISLRVTFGCSLPWKWASRRHVWQPWRTSDRMRRPNSGRFKQKPSNGACNRGRIDGASVWVFAQGSYCEGDYVSVIVCPTVREQYQHSGTFWLPNVCVCVCVCVRARARKCPALKVIR
jgi:hypothetical protein